MNKVEIICYIVSAYFFGISTGSFIAVGVHNHIYRDKKKRRPPKEAAVARRSIDGVELIKWLKDWQKSIDDSHRDPFVEAETLELVIHKIKREIGLEEADQ